MFAAATIQASNADQLEAEEKQLIIEIQRLQKRLDEVQQIRGTNIREVTCSVYALADLRPSPQSDLTAFQESFSEWLTGPAKGRKLKVTFQNDAKTKVAIFSTGSRAPLDPNALNIMVTMTATPLPAGARMVMKSTPYKVDPTDPVTIEAFEALADQLKRDQLQ